MKNINVRKKQYALIDGIHNRDQQQEKGGKMKLLNAS